MGLTTPMTSRTWTCSCVFIDAHPFSDPSQAGGARYTARLALALGARVPVRFFDGGEELLPPPGLEWSQDQDLEEWGRRIRSGGRRPLGTPPADSIGLYCAPMRRQRIFPYEVSILPDLRPIIEPSAFPGEDRDHFGKYLIETLPASDLVVSASRRMKADAAYFSSVAPERIVVAPPGPSLCVESHRHRGSVARSDRMGLVVSTIEPRTNAAFLLEWFRKTALLPPDAELRWVGNPAGMIAPDELGEESNPAGGRRIRFLDSASDGELCRLYQQARWSIVPWPYEGSGSPILDSLRHGTPVLASTTSSSVELDHPGVYFFDPQDPETLDSAWRRLEAARPVTIPQAGLDERFNWDDVARTILDAHARTVGGNPAGPTRSVRPDFDGPGADQANGAPPAPAASRTEPAVVAGLGAKAGLRIGIEMFGTQFPCSRNRGIGRCTRHLVAAMLAGDSDNEYVLYSREGLPTNYIPEAPNAVTRQLRPDPASGSATLLDVMQRLVDTNPDGLDILLVCHPLGYQTPARPVNGLKIAAVVYDLIPLIFQEEYFGGPEWIRNNYVQGLHRLRGYDTLLAISESCRNDFVSLLGLSPDRVVNMGAAGDGGSFVPDRTEPMQEESRRLLRMLGITGPFVFSVGDMDYRKNPWGLIDAFAMLPDELRRSHQLVLSYVVRGGCRGQVEQYARDRGVADQLVLTPWLSERALKPLYQRCAAFVFPSMYEGFGLPILEAMHCGAPVIAGNNSSQIEVVGDAGLLFNAADAGELAGHLARLLQELDWAREMGERAVVQARRFSWEATADKALEALTRLFEEPERAREMGEQAMVQARRYALGATADNGVLTRSHAAEPVDGPRLGRRRTARRRIAFFSPLPPSSAEVADDSARLLEELKHRYAIDLYHAVGFLPHIGLRSPEFGCYEYRLFERKARVQGYHALVYQMGDSHHHHYMYDILLRHPGIVTLHDLSLAGFHFSYAQRSGVDGDAHIRREFEAFCGARANGILRTIAARAGAPGRMPAACNERGIYLNGRILERAAAVVMHSTWCVEQMRSLLPNYVDKISVVAPGATALDPSPEERRAIRARFGMPPDALIIASVGRMHPTRMNAETVAAFAPLAREIPGALLFFAGKEDDEGEARREALELGLRQQVRFLGHRQAEVAAELAAIADIGVCLHRPPTGGENALALLDLLRLGVPTIVSDAGQSSAYPDSVVLKHRMESDGLAGLTRALRQLAEDRPRREAIGRAAWHYVRQNHAWSGTADSYEEVIERAVAGRGRPRTDGIAAAPAPRVVTAPERLQTAS